MKYLFIAFVLLISACAPVSSDYYYPAQYAAPAPQPAVYDWYGNWQQNRILAIEQQKANAMSEAAANQRLGNLLAIGSHRR